MKIQNQYFYIPDNRPFSIIDQYIPADSWVQEPRLTLYLSSCESTFELGFASKKGVKTLSETLDVLTEKSTKHPGTIHIHVPGLKEIN